MRLLSGVADHVVFHVAVTWRRAVGVEISRCAVGSKAAFVESGFQLLFDLAVAADQKGAGIRIGVYGCFRYRAPRPFASSDEHCFICMAERSLL